MSAFDPAHPEKVAGTSFVPVNGSVLRLDRPGDAPLFFERDAEDPAHVLVGPRPWLAEQDGRMARIMTDPEFKGGQTGFMFIDGVLRGLLIGGREYKVPAPTAHVMDPAVLWPESVARRREMEAPDIWRDGHRLRLWFDNPNKAGLLFAELCLAFLALLTLGRRHWTALGLTGSALSFGCLLWTSSRGGFLSLLCGLAVLCALRLRQLATRRNLLILGTAVLVGAGALFASGQADRLVGKLFTEERTTAAQRATSRLTIWREVPRMIVDAPGGWGVGRSAEAYIDWYQDNSSCLLKNLISGHLTFLVEHGWFVRSAYLLLWFFFLLFASVRGFTGASPFPAAVGTAFFIGGCFNPVVSERVLWMLPVAFGLPVARASLARMSRRVVGWTFACAALFVLLVGVGCAVAAPQLACGKGPSIARVGDAVLLNGRNPAVWLVDDDYVLHGGFWWLRGAEIRAHVGTDRPLGYTRDLSAVPHEVDRLVLVGETGRAFLSRPAADRPRARELVFLSPSFTWRDVPEDLHTQCKVSLVCGDRVVRTAGLKRKDAPAWVRVVPGAELYIPDWTKVLSL